jgi:hypothetical protein
LTQEFLGQMLGVRRTTVTIAAQLGLIRSRRGLIQIVDRPKLEELSCECHAVSLHGIRRRARRRLPSAAGSLTIDRFLHGG